MCKKYSRNFSNIILSYESKASHSSLIWPTLTPEGRQTGWQQWSKSNVSHKYKYAFSRLCSDSLSSSSSLLTITSGAPTNHHRNDEWLLWGYFCVMVGHLITSDSCLSVTKSALFYANERFWSKPFVHSQMTSLQMYKLRHVQMSIISKGLRP